MRQVILASGLFLAAPLGAAPAGAAEPVGVLLSYDTTIVPFDSGYHVVVTCNATADPGKLEDIPMATVVACSVNQMARNQGVPGREALTTINATIATTATVCVSGQATFIDAASNDLSLASAGPWCEELQV